MQVDRVYVGSPGVIAVLDHEKKRTFIIRKAGLPDTGKTFPPFTAPPSKLITEVMQ
jgi:hypothetical protein